jgi:hypothetical protein
MGGHAFPHLSTPRMHKPVYESVKSRLLTVLRQHFKHTDSPIPGPAKSDHGDIDIFVCEAFDEKSRDPVTLAKIVGATEWQRKGRGPVQLVVAWPEFDASEFMTVDAESEASTRVSSASTKSDDSSTTTPSSSTPPQTEKRYIQLDITILQSHSSFIWLLFLHSHSDLWPIIGSLLRRHGLTARPQGFYIHIPEILPHNRDKSLVKITEDSSLVLNYLELDEEIYWRGEFETRDDLCAYVATMKFADLGREKRREMHQLREAQENENAQPVLTNGDNAKADCYNATGTLSIPPTDFGTSSASLTPVPSRPPTPKLASISNKGYTIPIFDDKFSGLKSNDRRRLFSRPLFEYYHSVYVPAHSTVDTPSQRCSKMTTEEVIQDVKTFFGPDFARRYDEQRENGVKQVLEIKFWADVKNMIKEEGAEGADLGYGCKGVRSMIIGDERWAWSMEGCKGEFMHGLVEKSDEAAEEYRRVRKAWKDLRYEEVMGYVKANWAVAKAIQRAKDETESAKKKAEKRERDEKLSKIMDNKETRAGSGNIRAGQK